MDRTTLSPKDLKEYVVLIVEDDRLARESLAGSLGYYFKDVVLAADGEEAHKKLLGCKIDIILTDVYMPKINGIDFIASIRSLNCFIPVICMSSSTENNILLKALQLNISGYIVKPFKIEEVIEVILSTLRSSTVSTQDSPPNIYALKNAITVDLSNKTVTKDGGLVYLSKKEFELLEYLIDNRKRTVSREEIEAYMWNGFNTSSSVKSLVNKLRIKLGKDVLETVKNLGYMLL